MACIAADTLTTFGDIRLGSDLDRHHNKIQTFGKTHMGIVGSAAHTLVAERAFNDKSVKADFSTRDSAFDTLIRLHPVLKEQFFLNSKDAEDDPYMKNIRALKILPARVRRRVPSSIPPQSCH